MSTCDATTLDRIDQRSVRRGGTLVPPSTNAAAVSSHEVSIPSTSIGEAFDEGRPQHSALSDDRGDVFVWRDVERWIAHVRTVGRELIAADVRHLATVAFFDRDGVAVRGRQINRRQRRG